MFKKKKWWENILEKKYEAMPTRDKVYGGFEATVRNAKNDGYNKEEVRMIFVGHANCIPMGMYHLPLQLMWLDKFWEVIE